MEQDVQPCPDCGADVRTDPRFVTWCAVCDWNVDPGQPEAERGRLERVRRKLAQTHGEKLLAEVMAGGTLRPRRDLPGALALAIAVAVHGVTVLLGVAGILLVVLGWGGALPVLGVFLLALAWVLRPRFGRPPGRGPVLHRAAAPRLFALVDEVASVTGTTGVDVIALTADVNASVTTYGLRRRRLLVIGLGIWETLTPQQRVALLGHELGHYANGDTRHGLVIGNAIRSLSEWCHLVKPIRNPTGLEVVVNAVYLLPRCAIQGVLTLLDHLTLRATQRAEYLADSAAARAGSTEAAVGLMDRLLVTGSAETMLLREANARQVIRAGSTAGKNAWAGLWERLAAHMESIPESEYERQRRVGARRGHSVDSTHPPTHLRRACLLAGDPVPAEVVTDATARAAIETELAQARERLAREIVQGG